MRRNGHCLQCGIAEGTGNDGLCGSCRDQNEADERAIGHHVVNGHTAHCAQRLVWGDGECECGVENLELRDPEELLACINRLLHGAL